MANPTITVQRYQPARHYEVLCKWFHFYDLPPIDEDFLPPTGFVAEGLAMGFLVRTDTKVATMEPLVSNGYAPLAERDAAMDAVVTALLAEAKGLGYRVVEGFSTIDAVIARGRRLGFAVDAERFWHLTRVL
jgi:hypothetical protein